TPPTKRGGGPRTPEGVDASKRNALKYGLMAKEIFPAELQALIDGRTAGFTAQFQPTTPYEDFLIVEMGRAAGKLDRCDQLMHVDLQRCHDRACFFWDSDRRNYIEDLGARLARDPRRIAAVLEQTKQGVAWILDNWMGLSDALTTNR